MKVINLIGLFIYSFSISVKSQHINNSKMNSADSAWNSIKTMQMRAYASFSAKGKESVESLVAMENYYIFKREQGTKFWYAYPEDPRRYQWLIEAVSWGPNYWSDIKAGAALYAEGAQSIPVNDEKIRRWDKVVCPSLMYEFLHSPHVSDSLKHILTGAALLAYTDHRKWRNPRYHNNAKINMDTLKILFEATASKFYDPVRYKPKIHQYDPIKLIEQVVSKPRIYKISKDETMTFVKSFLLFEHAPVRSWAQGKLNLLRLIGAPFSYNIKGSTLNGSLIDLNKLKGKVVFLDFWSTSCASCIAAMPQLKETYTQYKEKGVEIISVCVNPEKDREKVEAIERKISGGWPTIIIGGNGTSNSLGGLAKKIWDDFSFGSVPQCFLIDKQGIVVKYNNELLSYKNLGSIIEEYIY